MNNQIQIYENIGKKRWMLYQIKTSLMKKNKKDKEIFQDQEFF